MFAGESDNTFILYIHVYTKGRVICVSYVKHRYMHYDKVTMLHALQLQMLSLENRKRHQNQHRFDAKPRVARRQVSLAAPKAAPRDPQGGALGPWEGAQEPITRDIIYNYI